MNTETIAFGLTEYAGIAFLILVVLFAGAFEPIRSYFDRTRSQQPVRLPRRARNESSRAGRCKP